MAMSFADQDGRFRERGGAYHGQSSLTSDEPHDGACIPESDLAHNLITMTVLGFVPQRDSRQA
jgi:hypothetical protein